MICTVFRAITTNAITEKMILHLKGNFVLEGVLGAKNSSSSQKESVTNSFGIEIVMNSFMIEIVMNSFEIEIDSNNILLDIL